MFVWWFYIPRYVICERRKKKIKSLFEKGVFFFFLARTTPLFLEIPFFLGICKRKEREREVDDNTLCRVSRFFF